MSKNLSYRVLFLAYKTFSMKIKYEFSLDL